MTLVTPASTRPAPVPMQSRPVAAPSPLRPAPVVARPAAGAAPSRSVAVPAMAEGTPTAHPAFSSSDAGSRLRPVVKPRPAAGAVSAASASASSAAPSPKGVKARPVAMFVAAREPADWSSTELSEGSDHSSDHSDATVELLTVLSSDHRAAPVRPVAHTIPRKEPALEPAAAALPRRLPKGTSPQAFGATPMRQRAQADEPTATDISLPEHTAADFQLEEYTTPNLPMAERTRAVTPLPSIRGRLPR